MRVPFVALAVLVLVAAPLVRDASGAAPLGRGASGAAPIPGEADAKTDGVPFAADAPATLAAMREVQANISGQNIHDCVAAVTSEGVTNYRVMGTPTQQAFLDAHKDVFEKLGLKSSFQKFAKGSAGVGPASSPVQGGTNLIGVLPGKDLTKWIVLGGHYDTREFTVGGGALDNASGFCTVTELARAYKAYVDAHAPLEASVVFAWYDGEEWGLYGSIALAEDSSVAKDLLGLAKDATVDVLVSQSYDMPGLNYPAKNTWVQYGDPTTTDEYAVLNLRTAPTHAEENWTCWSYGCYDKLKSRDDFDGILDRNVRYQSLVREVAYDLLQLPRAYVWVYDDAYGRSDHIPLIAKGAAGQRIQGSHDEEYPHYHQPTDTLPALYQLAGSKEALIAGYDTEARAGGLVAFYAALTGDVGPYGRDGVAHVKEKAPVVPSPIGTAAPNGGNGGNASTSATAATPIGRASTDAAPDAPTKGVPAPAIAVAIVALAGVSLLRRRR